MNDISDDVAGEEAVPLSRRAMVRRPAPYLDELNPAQREAAETLDGPVLMLAGAGTGKTRALTSRIAHLLESGRARPHEILAVTFTNKAAREMKSRVGALLGRTVEGMPWLGTFHSICAGLLRRHAELADLKPAFTILDADDQTRLLKQLLVAEKIDVKRWPPRLLAAIIDGWKNRAWTPKKVPASQEGAFDGRGVELYSQYQTRLRELNAADFGDLLLHVLEILRTREDVLEKYRRQFRYINVDEYQDTNVVQHLWLRLLARGHGNICCVGDDDQSIYGWRGAEVGNILRFEKDFPGAKIVRLEQNYRSTPHILAAASGVISANRERLGKTLWTDAADGEKIRLIGHWDGEEEARWIGEELESMRNGTRGMRPFGLDESAILVRATHQMRAFEDRFISIRLPYRVIGGPRFYDRLEIRGALAYFRVAVSHDDDLAFERIVNTPKRGVGDKALQVVHLAARAEGVGLLESARRCLAAGKLSGKACREVGVLIASFERWRDMAWDPKRNHVELAGLILDESGYTEMWQNDKAADAPGRLENLKELLEGMKQFENLQGFLEHVALVAENEEQETESKISIMTLHAAKGLEFPSVFLPGWEEGLFPLQRALDEAAIKGLEEERRLAYVGITRAEELCTISFAANRQVHGKWQAAMPSRFLDELPAANVDILTPSGLYSGGHRAEERAESALEEKAARADVYKSPGWRRLQARSGGLGASPPRRTEPRSTGSETVPVFAIGDRVFNIKYGYGFVKGADGDKLVVEFDKAGRKNVIAKYVVAEDSADDLLA